MKHLIFSTALCLLLAHGPALANADLEARVLRLEQLLSGLQEQSNRQNRVIAQLNKTIQRKNAIIQQQSPAIVEQQDHVADKPDNSSNSWYRNIEFSGLIEIEANHSNPYVGKNTSDMTLATVEMGIGSQVNDWTRADIVLLFEEDDSNLDIDTGTITIAPPDGNWFMTAGQLYVPIGAIESNMISDPLTLETGETRETALHVGTAEGLFSGSVYVFNGSNKKNSGSEDKIDNWGAELGFRQEGKSVHLAAGIGYINDIGDSDTVQDSLSSNNVRNHVPGWTAHVMAEAGGLTFIGEYLAATDHFKASELGFKGRGASPEAWNLEAGYHFSLLDRDSTLAVAYQGSNEAIALGLPKQRLLIGWSINALENTDLAFEWAHDTDYSSSEGGTGKAANTLTTLLSVAFP